MARQAPTGTGTGFLRRVACVAVLLGALVLVLRYPNDAAGWASATVTFLSGLVDAIANFLQHLSE